MVVAAVGVGLEGIAEEGGEKGGRRGERVFVMVVGKVGGGVQLLDALVEEGEEGAGEVAEAEVGVVEAVDIEDEGIWRLVVGGLKIGVDAMMESGGGWGGAVGCGGLRLTNSSRSLACPEARRWGLVVETEVVVGKVEEVRVVGGREAVKAFQFREFCGVLGNGVLEGECIG